MLKSKKTSIGLFCLFGLANLLLDGCKTCECPAYSMQQKANTLTEKEFTKAKDEAGGNIIYDSKHIAMYVDQNTCSGYQNINFNYYFVY